MKEVNELPLLDTGFFDKTVVQQGASEGPLAGLKFAVKDVMDVAGSITGMGHPEWRASHQPARANARVIDQCLEAGAGLNGKTHTDELTYSLAGQNAHYGMPPNPAVPDGITGGSSSGSASVTAAGLVDFALGTDTGGSVRIPASYCRLFGFRPTVGSVESEGVAALARSFDTVGWFSRDPDTLARVGNVLLPEDRANNADSTSVRPLASALDLVDANLADQFQSTLASSGKTIGATVDPAALPHLQDIFRRRQAWEAWTYFGAWIEARKPAFSSGIRERFAAASRVSPEEGKSAREEVTSMRMALRNQIEGYVWALPTASCAAPARNSDSTTIDAVRNRTLQMTAVAGIAGCPQVTLPLLGDAQGPVGLSLIGPAGSDRWLLRQAVDIASKIGTAARPMH